MTPADFKRFRRELGLTQAQLGRLLAIHPQTVYRREAGMRRIRVPEALLLRALMELTPTQRAELIAAELDE